MFGKIVQLLGVPARNEFKVVYGIGGVDFKHSVRHQLNFGEVTFGNMNPDVSKTYIYGGHLVNEKADGFKEVMIFNGELSEEDNEEYLLVIIPYAFQLKTNAKKIAGRYPNEAILEMYAGNTVEVSKSSNGKRDIYMAVKAGNEMFLIKKSR